MQKKKKKDLKKKKISKIILIILIISLILLFFFLLIQFQEKFSLKNLLKKPELFIIKDKCSLIFNNIIHEIKSPEECKIFCKNECRIREKEFYGSEFMESNNSCHICNCYCK